MVMNAIINRKSVRKYSEKPISDEVLNKILEAGRLAPSWVNVQPWKFIVVKNQETKESIVTSKLLNPSTLGEQIALLRSVEQVTYAVAYMTLEAEEQGVGCCVVGATSNELTNLDESYAEQVKTKLNLNNRQVLVDILALGYEEPITQGKKFRKSTSEVIFQETL